MSIHKEIAIIGGGACGCSIAYHLAKQRVTSQIIEKDAIASQASGKAWAVVSTPPRLLLFFDGIEVPKGSMRPSISLFHECFKRFPQLAKELQEEGKIDIGYGVLPAIYTVSDEAEEAYVKKGVAELTAEGYEISWLEENEVKARLPGIKSGVRGGVTYPGLQVEPYRYTLSLFQAAEAHGASMKQGEAVGFRQKRSRVTSVILASGEVEADTFVIAMGPWSAKAASWLRKEVPMTVTRTECLKARVPRQLPRFRLLSKHSAIIPQVDGTVVLAGGGERVLAPDFDSNPTEKARAEITDAVVEILPTLEEAKLIEQRAGLLAWQPGGALPMLGRLSGMDNVYIATWLAAWGIQWSPGIGRAMAELIIKGRIEPFVEALSPASLVKNL